MPWYTVWINALTKPSVDAYEAIVSQPAVSTGTASLWVFLASTLGYIISIAVLLAFPTLFPSFGQAPSGDAGSFSLLLLCLAPIGGLFSVLGLYISAGLSHIVARALGGVGTFPQLAYAIAAYTSPISIVGAVIGLIPLVNCLGLLIGAYAIGLNILSVKAVHKFSWGRAVLSSAVIIGLLIALVGCLVIVVLALMGPAVGDVFSGIITELGTPVP
jgi:hypothetical protein